MLGAARHQCIALSPRKHTITVIDLLDASTSIRIPKEEACTRSRLLVEDESLVEFVKLGCRCQLRSVWTNSRSL